jgi:anhydro-N-acetylmuramic acid kinase
MEKILEILKKDKKKVIGLMSGTSADGVDSALVEIEGHGLDTRIKLLEFITYPIPKGIKSLLFDIFPPAKCSVEDICRLNFAIGEVFAEAVLEVIKKSGISIDDIDLIGSHGQTICHLPNEKMKSTLQIGEPAVIANRTGIITIADFRVADVAVGGQGAPLVPYVDFLLLRDEKKSRAIQNIGGISNVTVLPAGSDLDKVIAFDTGPGNMIIDEIVRIITNNSQNYDYNGEIAGKGISNDDLLTELLNHPFINLDPPKTTGREAFGRYFAKSLIEQAKSKGIYGSDLVATVTEFTARSIYENYKKFILPSYDISEILVCGGGAHNETLMNLLNVLFYPINVCEVDNFGLSSDAKEAIAFAVLANETIHGNPSNVPSATGATRPVVLGKIVI